MMPRLFREFCRSEDGAAVVELAIVASTLALMLVGVVDITTAFNRKIEMEQSLHRSLEMILNTTLTMTPTETIKTQVADALPYVTADDVEVDYILECNGEQQVQAEAPPTPEGEEPDASEECPGTGTVQRRYVTARVTNDYTPFFSLHNLGFKKTTFTITATAGMRVE